MFKNLLHATFSRVQTFEEMYSTQKALLNKWEISSRNTILPNQNQEQNEMSDIS
jgi:hypothetical protein